jgi:hypothetical protein
MVKVYILWLPERSSHHETYGGIAKKEMSNFVSEEEKHIVFSVTMPRYLVKQIDTTRGYTPRSAWLKALAINELKRLQGLQIGANPEASQAVISSIHRQCHQSDVIVPGGSS